MNKHTPPPVESDLKGVKFAPVRTEPGQRVRFCSEQHNAVVIIPSHDQKGIGDDNGIDASMKESAAPAPNTLTNGTSAAAAAAPATAPATAPSSSSSSSFAANVKRINEEIAQRACAVPVLFNEGASLCMSTHVHLVEFSRVNADHVIRADSVFVARMTALKAKLPVHARFVGTLDVLECVVRDYRAVMTLGQADIGRRAVRAYMLAHLITIEADVVAAEEFARPLERAEFRLLLWAEAVTFFHKSQNGPEHATARGRVVAAAKQLLAQQWLHDAEHGYTRPSPRPGALDATRSAKLFASKDEARMQLCYDAQLSIAASLKREFLAAVGEKHIQPLIASDLAVAVSQAC